ncbi:MAG: hypothetical protein AAFN92_12210 [Bacteroidota bacterium]
MPNKEELPEKLRELRERGDGFVAPGPDYFARLAETAREQAMTETTPVRRLRYLRPWRMAAAILFFGLVAFWLLRSPTTAKTGPTSEELLAEISPDAIEAYIDAELEDFGTELLTEVADNY